MKIKLISVISVFLCLCIFVGGCFFQDSEEKMEKVLPDNTSYFDLLGISVGNIEKIEVLYMSKQEENYEKRLEIDPNDVLYTGIIETLEKLKLTKDDTLDWIQIKDRYVFGCVQLVFVADGNEYLLPVLDVYQKETSKPHPISWAIYGDSTVYNIDYSECWSEKEFQGIALYLAKCLDLYIADSNAVNIPAYYGINQNAYSWLFDCNLSNIYSYSDFVFRGRVLDASYENGYKVKVIESYKGDWENGYVFSYKDGTGFKENGVYNALVNETDRPLNSESEYIFFMKQHPFAENFDQKEGMEYVYLSDRQCGICEIIDNQVWPIFNAIPKTSWYVGQTVEELVESWS